MDEDIRLDLYLSNQMEQRSRNYIQKLIEKGNVQVNGSCCNIKKYKVKESDTIEVRIDEPEILKIKPENIPIEIVYEDEDLLIVNKPQGMVVHPAPGNYSGTLVNALLYHCKNLSTINGTTRPGIVHRIDKDTSGLLMIAKTNKAHESLAKQLKDHSIHRIYLALVYGVIQEEKGTIQTYIGRHPVNRLKMAVVMENGKKAITHFTVLKRFDHYTFVQAKLETGRTHQIRVHMSYIHHPLLGDPVYGYKKEKFNLNGQLLHAQILGFIHPSRGVYMEFKSDLPDSFQKVLKVLENNNRQ